MYRDHPAGITASIHASVRPGYRDTGQALGHPSSPVSMLPGDHGYQGRASYRVAIADGKLSAAPRAGGGRRSIPRSTVSAPICLPPTYH